MTMEDAAEKTTPLSYRIMCVLLLLLAGFGVYDYTMIRRHDHQYLTDMGSVPAAVFKWYGAYPLWADIVWSMYTWAGLAGALLLLVRSRRAVTAFLICVFAAIVNLAYHQIYPVPAELDKIWPNSIPFVIVALMVGQFWFELRKANDGTLR